MKNKINLLGAISIVLVAGWIQGCQTVPYQGQARDVKRKPNAEGVISIAMDHRPEDRAKAEEKMKSNCGNYPVEVLEEGEVAVGQSVSTTGRETDRASTKRQVGSLFGVPLVSGEEAGRDSSTNSVTTAVKEWHITYKCNTKAANRRRL